MRRTGEPMTLSLPPFTRAVTWLLGINTGIFLLRFVLSWHESLPGDSLLSTFRADPTRCRFSWLALAAGDLRLHAF